MPHAPEISLHVADEATELWQKTEDELGAIGQRQARLEADDRTDIVTDRLAAERGWQDRQAGQRRVGIREPALRAGKRDTSEVNQRHARRQLLFRPRDGREGAVPLHRSDGDRRPLLRRNDLNGLHRCVP